MGKPLFRRSWCREEWNQTGKDLDRSASIIKASKNLPPTPAGLSVPEKGKKVKVTEAPSCDNSSEEYILDGPRIVKTLDVTVSRDSDGDEYHGRRYR
jgi:hypothetical protein